ncbi:hypothetical protein [Rheinheimera sp.]|uniref:hypothetical protein n=1 Tax=Rheinheimera sp. TaxID=1869214 RepID=UPI00059158CF
MSVLFRDTRAISVMSATAAKRTFSFSKNLALLDLLFAHSEDCLRANSGHTLNFSLPFKLPKALIDGNKGNNLI